MTTTYTVPDISCEHCRSAIAAAVSPVPGVEEVEVAIDARTVTVSGDFDDAAVRAAIDDAGYDIA
jgi:copper chaperone